MVSLEKGVLDVSLLGTMLDRELGQRYGMTQGAITRIRSKLGIPAFVQPHNWTQEQLARLGVDTDLAIASDIGLSKSTVSKKRTEMGIAPAGLVVWSTPMLDALAKMSTLEFAKEFNMPVSTVYMKRKRLGLLSQSAYGSEVDRATPGA